MDFVKQNYWDSSYRDFNFHVADDEVTRWIDEQSAGWNTAGSVFEFGCFPGRYLAFMGKKGLVVNGIDMTPGIEDPKFQHWLKTEGIATGMLQQGDALAYAENTQDRYDLVCSFGFIEHFQNFLEVLDLHDRLLNHGGRLMVTTPNFRGPVQKFLHQSLNAEALAIHYLPSMRPQVWKERLEAKGYKINWAGYFGGFDFWYDDARRNTLQRTALKIVRKAKPFLRGLPRHPAYAPYCGILAQKVRR